jgi:hypothetical protein
VTSPGSGYQVTPAMLQETAKGINDTISALKDLGVEGTADAGRGFSDMELTGMQVGHAGLMNAFNSFCDKGSWGVRTLVQDGNTYAEQLGLNAGAYYDAEQYASGTFKDLYADALGNPDLTDQQVEAQSWSTTLADNPLNDVLHPDYSAASADKAQADIAATWKAEGRDAMNGFEGMNQTLAQQAGVGAQFNQAEDDMFGPAPTTTSSAEGMKFRAKGGGQ